MLSLRVTPSFLDFIGFGPINPARVREEEQPSVRCGDKEVLHNVVGSQLGAFNPFTAAVLASIVITAGSLDVPTASDGNHHFFFRNQIFVCHPAIESHKNFGPTVIPVAISNLRKLLRNNRALTFFASQDGLVVGNQSF